MVGGDFAPHYIGVLGGHIFLSVLSTEPHTWSINSSQQACEVICIIIPIFQKRKWRHQGQVPLRVQGHKALFASHSTALALESLGRELEKDAAHGASFISTDSL